MLNVSNLSKRYGTLEVLKGISFEIKKGTIYGFLGPNGAGKTTTMNILSGLIGYNGGEIIIDGKDLRRNKRELLKRIGYLPQNPVFYGYMTAVEYLEFIGKIHNMTKKQIGVRAKELIGMVGLNDAAKRRVGGYSGGMRQRFGIASALFKNPDILFLDEPTSALDPEGRMEVLEFIKGLKNQGITVFLSTHILNDIERVCDQVSILDNGRILISDRLENLKNKYIQPIFDVEFDKLPEGLSKKLADIRWIDRVKANGNKLSIYVKDLNTAKNGLLNLLIDDKYPVISYNLRKSNLEDIFIRLVNTNGSIQRIS